MPDDRQPKDSFLPGSPIPASWLNRVAEAVVQRLVGARGVNVKRIGSRAIIEGPRRQGGTQLDRFGIITGSTANGNRWDYTVDYPAEKSAPGYGNWQAATGATSVTARNIWEEIDPTTRVTRDPDSDSTNEVTLEALKTGSIVLIRQVPDGSGGTEWWIVAAGIPVDANVSC